MHVPVRTVEHELAFMECAALDKTQLRPLAGVAAHVLVFILEVVASIPRTKVAARQKREIVIVRNTVNKGLGPAIAEAEIVLRWPDICAQEHLAAQGTENDRLRSIAAIDLTRASTGEAVDQQVGEKVSLVVQSPQPVGSDGGAFRFAWIEIEAGEGFDAVWQSALAG